MGRRTLCIAAVCRVGCSPGKPGAGSLRGRWRAESHGHMATCSLAHQTPKRQRVSRSARPAPTGPDTPPARTNSPNSKCQEVPDSANPHHSAESHGHMLACSRTRPHNVPGSVWECRPARPQRATGAPSPRTTAAQPTSPLTPSRRRTSLAGPPTPNRE